MEETRRSVLILDMGDISISKRRLAGKRQMRPQSAFDIERMTEIAEFTGRSLSTRCPRPFGASIIHTKSGELLLRALNNVAQAFDPTAHAEVRAIRLATKRIQNTSLAGYTLYTTCEPCPMCMSAALWARLDRVVFGATIEDANRHCNQIQISAVEVTERSDMQCAVVGPVLRDQCYSLFTDPRMLKAFRLWTSRKHK